MKPEPQFNFIVSFKCAYEGIRYAISTQRNFRFHLSAALIVVIAAWMLRIDAVAWAVLVLTMGGVIVVELINTAVEVMVDLVSPDYHPLAKTVKDLAAGAVLLAAIGSVIVGIIILGPPLWQLIVKVL